MPNTGSTAFSSFSGTGWTSPSNASADDASYAVSPNISDTAAGCFVAGSMVLTSRGELPIETIKLGDTVRDKFGNDVIVTRTIKHRAKEVCVLTVESLMPFTKDRVTIASPDHPFEVETLDADGCPEYHFVQCGDLNFDHVTSGIVVSNERRSGVYDVFNLTVDGSHTFVVNGNIVHNK